MSLQISEVKVPTNGLLSKPSTYYKCFAIAITCTIFSYYLYSCWGWWMFICCMLAYFSQLLAICPLLEKSISINITQENHISTIKSYQKKCNWNKIPFGIFYLIIILVDLFPIFSINESFSNYFSIPIYEGGLFCYILTSVITLLWITSLITTFCFNFKDEFNNSLNKTINEQKLKEEKVKEEENKQKEQQQQINQLKRLYGDNYITLKNDSFNQIIISNEKQCVVIFDQEYQFKDILNYSLVDDAKNITTTATSGDAKTSTGNMLGRAVVGGVLTGGVGAAVGAVSAKKNIETTSTSQTNIVHNYTLYININSLENPTIKIPVGNDTEMAQKLANTINVIIERNKNS